MTDQAETPPLFRELQGLKRHELIEFHDSMAKEGRAMARYWAAAIYRLDERRKVWAMLGLTLTNTVFVAVTVLKNC